MIFQSQMWFDPLDTAEIRRLTEELLAARVVVTSTTQAISDAKINIWRDQIDRAGIIIGKTVVDIWETFGKNSIVPANYHKSSNGYIITDVTESGYVVAKIKPDGTTYPDTLTTYGKIIHATRRKR